MKYQSLLYAGLAAIVIMAQANSQDVPAAKDGTTQQAQRPSVSVFPVASKPHKFPDDLAKRVGMVIATFLERAGINDLEVVDTVFTPPDTDDISQIAAEFGKLVADTAIDTDVCVFAQFLGSPQTGVDEIRTIVVDKQGKVLLADSSRGAQLADALVRPTDPMTCCSYVSQRLQEFWKLDDPLRKNAPEGKMSRFWREDAGIPSDSELQEIKKKREALKGKLASVTFSVYPIRVGPRSDSPAAKELADKLNENAFCTAQVEEMDPKLEVAGHSNEQKVLWDTARAFSQFIRQHRPSSDYAVYADYGLFGNKVGYVHVIVCDQSGDWVLVDMQNSHHADFQRVNPKSVSDCSRLLLVRLQHWLGK